MSSIQVAMNSVRFQRKTNVCGNCLHQQTRIEDGYTKRVCAKHCFYVRSDSTCAEHSSKSMPSNKQFNRRGAK